MMSKLCYLALNMSDIIADAIPRFLKQGLGAIGIDALTEYNGTSYANYRLGQALYGVRLSAMKIRAKVAF